MSSTAPTDIDDLLAHAGLVRSLARAALGRDEDVEDVVQDTWLAALRRGPSRRDATRGWLARVVRNRVIGIRRREDVRRRHPPPTRPASGGRAPDEIAERAETRRRLAGALLALEPLYRDPLVLRYYEDLPPREIAARLSVPVETARTRLKRGLVRLRERLDAIHGGDRRRWALALLPLAELPDVEAEPEPSGASRGVPKILLGTALVVGLALVAWHLATRVETPAGEEPVQEGRVASTGAGRGEAAPSPAPGRSGPAPESGHAEASETATGTGTTEVRGEAPVEPLSDDDIKRMSRGAAPRTVEGVVLRGKEPVVEGEILLRSTRVGELPRDGRRPADLRTAGLDAEGRFRFGDVEPGDYHVGVHLAGSLAREFRVRVLERHGARVVLALGTTRIEGRVYDGDGRPRTGATVRVSTFGTPGFPFSVLARTGPDGEFAVDGLRAGTYWVGEEAGTAESSRARQVVVPTGGTVRVDLGQAGLLGAWSGAVRTVSGDLIRGPYMLHLRNAATDERTYDVKVDPRGRFTHRLAPGEYVVGAWLPGWTSWTRVGVVTMGKGDLALDLEVPGARISGRLLVRAGVELSPRVWRNCQIRLKALDRGETARDYLLLGAREDGTFTIDGVRPGRYRVLLHPYRTASGALGEREITVGETDREVLVELLVTFE